MIIKLEQCFSIQFVEIFTSICVLLFGPEFQSEFLITKMFYKMKLNIIFAIYKTV